MRSQLKNSILTLVPIIGLIGLWSCGPGPTTGPGPTPTPVPPNTPGSINGTLNMKVSGGTSITCTGPAVTWTASSPSGSPQTKTSPAITTSDNVQSQCSTVNIEGTTSTSCYCPVQVSF